MIPINNPSKTTIKVGIFILMSTCFQWTHSQIYKGYFEIPRLKNQPEIDAILNLHEWEGAAHFSDFTVWTLDQYVPEKTEVWAGYDDQNIYFFFKGQFLDKNLFESFMEEHKAIDSHMWGRTHFGVSLSGGNASIQVKCGPTLSRMDFKDGDLSWNGSWDFKAVVHDDHWMGEYSIPFSAFNLEWAPVDEEWMISLVHSNPSGESSNWSGRVKFVEDKDLYVEFKPWSSPLPGKNQLQVRWQNKGSTSALVKCKLSLIPFSGYPEFVDQKGQGNNPAMLLGVNGIPLISDTILELGENKEADQFIGFDLPEEGNYYASVMCSDDDGRQIRQSQGYWFTLTPNSDRLQKATKKLGEAISIIHQLPTSRQGKMLDFGDKIKSKVKGLEKALPQYWENQDWELLSGKVDTLERDILRFLHRAKLSSLSSHQGENTFGIAAHHSLSKLKRDAEFPGQVTEFISLSGARNEYESFQLALLPLKGDLNGIQVMASDLKSDDEGIIPTENIEISLIEYNLIKWQANYVNEQKGWHPDPLIPIQGPLNLSGYDLCRPLWITIRVPDQARPGKYKGQITVSANGNEHHTVEVAFQVWDFTLPVESNLKTHTWDNIETFEDFYDVETLPVDWYMNFCDVLLKNRLNPSFAGANYLERDPSDGKYDFSTVEKVLENAIGKGMNRFSMIQMKKGDYQPDQLAAEYQFIKEYADFLRTKGWLDKALVEVWDEPTVLQWEKVKQRAEEIKKISPDIPLQLFAGGSEPYMFWEPSVSEKYGLLDLIDIWAPHLLVNAPELQQEGKEIWTYFCTLARNNAPNLYIDTPPIYQRSIAWYCWMHGVDGFEHWSTTYFWRNAHKGLRPEQKWPAKPWDSRTFHDFHGEGQLIYPGPQGKIYPSLRLEVFRDGMEDYEYLYMLKELLNSMDANGDNKLLLQQANDLLRVGEYMLIQYPHDVQITLENTIRFPDQPERILETREEIAQTIEKLIAIKSNQH